ncbi:hypothetical protein BDP27DRAFT_1333695 [Rhodocollybia butyracea]|uniref:Uncharacterized protein n=1 Tax=Rhodocollybia butyracea TaxID=206335 RepID=A0A9P5PJ51_9AGAR|nr:hypothetical protein BDP27DRAFT_1333695 [Rhodocollybia butyracea]
MLTMLNSRSRHRETLSQPVTDSDFIRRSLSNSKTRKGRHLTITRDTIQAFPDFSGEIMPDSDSEIDSKSRQVSGILVSQEKITAIDYVNPRSPA